MFHVCLIICFYVISLWSLVFQCPSYKCVWPPVSCFWSHSWLLYLLVAKSSVVPQRPSQLRDWWWWWWWWWVFLSLEPPAVWQTFLVPVWRVPNLPHFLRGGLDGLQAEPCAPRPNPGLAAPVTGHVALHAQADCHVAHQSAPTSTRWPQVGSAYVSQAWLSTDMLFPGRFCVTWLIKVYLHQRAKPVCHLVD